MKYPDHLAGIATLADRWRLRVADADRERKLPGETVSELFDAGLLQLAAPTSYGGPALGWPALADAARLAARTCPSTGWIIGVVGGHAALASRLPGPIRERMFADGPPQLFATASAVAGGRITRAPGGFEVTGRWRFCSGVDHAKWIIVNGVCEGESPAERVLIPLRVDRIRIADGWHVSGMSATGSKDIVVDGLFAPADQVGSLPLCIAERWSHQPGAPTDYLGEVPLLHYINSTIIGPILGCAEGAFVAYLESAGSGVLAQSFTQDGLTESSAELACAGHLYDSLCATLHSAGVGRRAVTRVEAGEIMRDRAYLTRLCVRAIHRLVQLRGTAAHHDDGPIARHWRDLQMMAAHRDVSWALSFPAYAAVAVGRSA